MPDAGPPAFHITHEHRRFRWSWTRLWTTPATVDKPCGRRTGAENSPRYTSSSPGSPADRVVHRTTMSPYRRQRAGGRLNPATPARCATPGTRGAVSTARVGARPVFGCRRGVRRSRGLRGGGDLRVRRPSLGPGSRRLSDAGRAAGDHLLLRAPGMLPVPGSATRLRERRRTAGRVGCGGAAFLRNAHRGRAGGCSRRSVVHGYC